MGASENYKVRKGDQGMPESWDVASLGEICEKPQYGYTTKAAGEGSIKLLRTTDITSGKIDWGTVPYCSTDPEDLDKYLLRHNDIVVSRAGSVGVSHLVQNPERSVFASYLIRFLPRINPEYVRYFLESPKYWQAISEHKMGIAVPNVNASKLSQISVPVAPLNEQRRIVAKIEELFSELDKGVESLKTARAQLKTYRQSLLKAAFEGRLTEQWRRDNADKLETADQLLQRIREEREARYQQKLNDWEVAVSEWEESGKPGKKPGKPRVMKELPMVSSDERASLGQLPAEWTATRLGALNVAVFDGPFGSNLTRRDYVGSGVRVIRLENIGDWVFYNDKQSFVSEAKYQTIKKHTVYPGDLIFSSFVADGTRVAAVPSSVPYAINKADCFCVRLFGDSVCSDFVGRYLSTRQVYRQLAAEIHGATRPRVNTTQLQNVVIPVCSNAEQNVIIEVLEAAFSEIEQIEATIQVALKQSEILRQSILRRAFEGKLVPQDPDDEPASALLERIRQEQADAPKLKRRKRKAEASA